MISTVVPRNGDGRIFGLSAIKLLLDKSQKHKNQGREYRIQTFCVGRTKTNGLRESTSNRAKEGRNLGFIGYQNA